MSIYDAFEKVAKKQLGKFGVEATITQETSTSFNPVTGVDTVTTVTFTGYGVKSAYKKSELVDSEILATDVKFLMERTDTVPKVGDKVAINGAGSYRIMNVDPTAPAEEDVIYTLQLRR